METQSTPSPPGDSERNEAATEPHGGSSPPHAPRRQFWGRQRVDRPIEVRVRSVSQLFDSMDPSPFIERDIDPDAEHYIVSWAREYPRHAKLSLRITIQEEPSFSDYRERIATGIRNYFNYRQEMTRHEFSQLMRRGRKSLLIGLACLVLCVLLVEALNPEGIWRIVRESLLIGGWVAMWRPIQIFLYEWWPLRDEIALYHRLAHMPIRFSDEWKKPIPPTTL